MRTFTFFLKKVNTKDGKGKRQKTQRIREDGSTAAHGTCRLQSMGLLSLKQLLVFFYGIISVSYASQSFTYKDTVLTGSVIRTLLNVDWFQCLELCCSTSECQSYNFCMRSTNTGVCELNKCSVDAVKLCGQDKALRHRKHCVFHHLKPNQVCFE